VLLFACRQSPELRSHPLDLIPDEQRPASMAADQAARQLQERLAARLIGEMARSGPVGEERL
jgi:hypothetical protein